MPICSHRTPLLHELLQIPKDASSPQMQRKIMPLLPATDRVGRWFVTCPVGRWGDQVPPEERENKALCILVHGKGVSG